MLKKYYKEKDSKTFYWEFWDVDNETLLFHKGEVGTIGECYQKKAGINETIQSIAQNETDLILKEGYKELDENGMVHLIFQIKLESWGTPQDLDVRETHRDFLSKLLGWTGNGHCDDGDIGSGTMNLFPEVIDPYIAMKTIVNEIKSQNLNIEYLIAIEDIDSTKVIYPENFLGTFSY